MFHPRRLLLVAASSLALTGLMTLPAQAYTEAEAGSAQAPAQTPATGGVWAHENSDLSVDPDVRFGVLPNGMRYALRKNATPPGQAILRLRVATGSLMEAEDQRGLAHFVEHMVFNGTTNTPKTEMLRVLERLGLAFGPDTNAHTAFDETVYKLQLPRTNDETVDTSLRVMHEQVAMALLADEDIEEERGVVESELRSRNTPGYRNMVAQINLLAEGQLISTRLPIGDVEVIRKAPPSRLVDYYKTFYRPERAVLVAVGDFDVDKMEAKIKAEFSSWQSKTPDGPEPDLGRVKPREPSTKILVEDGLSSSVQLIWVKDYENRPDGFATRQREALNAFAYGILNRRLGEIARSDNPPFLGAGGSYGNLFKSLDQNSVAAGFAPGGLKSALEAIDLERRRMLEFGVTQVEIDREVTNVRTAMQSAVDSASTRNSLGLAESLLSSIANDQIATTPQYQKELAERIIPTLTVEAINAAFREGFEGYGPMILVTSPVPIEGGEEAVTEIFEASQKTPVIASAEQVKLDWPYEDFGTVGKVTSTSAFAPMDATLVTFENGVRLMVKPTDFKKEEIQITVRTGTGTSTLPKDRYTPGLFGSQLFTMGGLGKLTVDQLNNTLTGRVAGVNFASDDRNYQFGGSTRPQDLELQMQLMAAYLTDPALRSAPFEKLKLAYPQVLPMSLTTPSGAFGVKATPILTDGDRREILPSNEEVQQSTNDQLKAQMLDGLSTGPISIVMVGDLTVEAAVASVAKTFGALPPRPERAPGLPGYDQRRFPAPTPEPIVFTHTGLAEQGLAVISFPTTDQIKDRTTARRLNLLASVLSLRALDEIREKRALTYSPGVSSDTSSLYKDFGALTFSAEVRPENFDAFFEAVHQLVEDIKAKPPTEDEVTRARAPVVESYRRSLNYNSFWISQLEDLAFDQSELGERLNFLEVYEAITPEQLQEVAKTYLLPEKAWKAVVQKGD